tara:strand:+ start:321 stop:497 length:177 start_codon:yes stop_codon:yes gene_type:complete
MKLTNKAGTSLPKRPSKKELIREIIEIPTKTGGEFDHVSLERTNIADLQLLREILLAR